MTSVLFLGGFGRSGTTLLQRLLGELPGVWCVGEVVDLWRRGLLDNEGCGCEQVFHDCPFWREVGKIAFGGWDRIDADHVLGLKASLDRITLIPRLAATWLDPRLRRRLAEYNAIHVQLYAAIAAASGCSVVADASKHAPQAFCLRWATDLDLRIVHIVRDSRGVAYSWTKKVRRPEAGTPNSLMDRFSPTHASMLWNAYNIAFEVLSYRRVPMLRVRYEDLVRAPARVLREIADFAGLPVDEQTLSFLGEGYAQLTQSHTVAGNPMRFETGKIAVREDDAWRVRFPTWQRAVVSAFTLPLLMRYGYIGRRGSE